LSASYIHPSKRTVNKSSQPKSHSASQQRVIRRPQNTRPSLNKSFESNDQEIVKPHSQNNFPEGKDSKRAPKRTSLSPARDSREEPRNFLRSGRYREDYRSVSRSMARDPEAEYSASSRHDPDSGGGDLDSEQVKEKRLSTSSKTSFQSSNSKNSTVYVVVHEAPSEPTSHRRDPSLIFGPNPSVTRDFLDDFMDAVQESDEEEEDNNYSSILAEMEKLRASEERESESMSDSDEEQKEDEVEDSKKNPFLMGELRLALASRKKGSNKQKKKKKKEKKAKKAKQKVEEVEENSEMDGPDLLHDLSETLVNNNKEITSIEERFRMTALHLDEPDSAGFFESEEEQSVGPLFLEDEPVKESEKLEPDIVDIAIEQKFKALSAMQNDVKRKEAERSKSAVVDLESEIELLQTQLRLSKEKLRDTMTKSVNRTEKLMLQISKCRSENEELKRENFSLRQKSIVAEHQNLTDHENLHENQLQQLDKLLEENAHLREKSVMDQQDLQLRLAEVKRQLDKALTDILETKRANSNLQGELERYMKRGMELTKQLTHVKAELETTRTSQIRVKQEFDTTIQATSGDVLSMRGRIATLEAQANVQREEKQRILSDVQDLRLKLDEANSKLVDQTFKSSSRTSELNKKLSQKEQKIKELSAKPQGFQQEISSWQLRCRMLVEQNESMQDDLIEANAKVEGLGNRLVLVQDEVSSLKSEMRDGKERELRLHEKVQRAESNTLSVNGELQNAKDQLHRQERQAKEHSEQVKRLSKRIEELQTENDEGMTKRKKISEDLRAQVSKLKESLQSKNQEQRDVEKRFESRLTTLKSEMNALSSENESLQQELMDDSELKRQDELQNQLNEMREQIASVNSQLVDQTFKHSQRISELNKRVAEKEQVIQDLRDELQKKGETT